MNKIEIRPRFNIESTLNLNEIVGRITQEVEKCNGKCKINLVKNHIIFKIPEEMQHFWSPELSIEIEESNDRSLLRCILGPKPSIWTMYVAFYAVSIFIGLVGLVLGLAQWAIGMDPVGLWLLPLSLILTLFAYIIAFTGQKLSYNEMVFLRTKLDHALNKKKE